MNTTDIMETTQELSKQLNRIEKQLEKVRGVSPLTHGWQTSRYAKAARKWDELAKEKDRLLEALYSHPDYEDGMRLAEQQTIIE
jgi:hypothetical protein